MKAIPMAVHVHSLSETLLTYGALKRSGLFVEADVGLQGAGMGKGFGA